MKRLRPLVLAVALSLVASLAALAFYLAPPGVATFANRVADYTFVNQALGFIEQHNLLGAFHYRPINVDAASNDLVLIRIDEESIDNANAGLPAWPYPRSIYEKLLAKLKAAGAKTAMFDIDFLDPASDPTQDAAFAQGMKAMPTVLPFVINTTSAGQLGVEPVAPSLSPFTTAQGYSTVESTGILLGQPLVIKAGSARYLSLASAAVQAYTGKKISSGAFGGAPVPRSHDGVMYLLPFHELARQDIDQRVGAAEATVPFVMSISLADAMTESTADLAQLVQGKLVVLGATAQALGDFITTPFGRFPGVFSNLRFMDQLLTHRFITPAPQSLDIALIFLLPLLLSLLVTYGNATRNIILCLLLVAAYVISMSLLYASTLYWVDVMHVGTAMFGATLLVSIQRVVRESADRRMVTNLFGMHVSPAIVSDILKQDDPRSALALTGKKVKATIFYSDIRGFTAMSETMTPEAIYAQLNEYFEEMCAIIFQYGGYVDKFIGDCVMAVFSAPYQTPDDAANAVRAAVAQQKKILELAAKWKSEGKREFTVGMGINTGDVVMGNLGASSRMNYTVIGDNVNLAARLYNVAKAGEIIISDYTYQEVKEFVVAEEREAVTVKGKKDPIAIYNILDVKGNEATNV